MAKANQYAADCHKCGGRVEAGEGLLDGRDNVLGKWLVKHEECPAVVPTKVVSNIVEAGEAVKQTVVRFPPTAEQQAIIDLFLTGVSMVIEAGAGAGKTSTLRLLAEAAPERTMQYLSFNTAIAEEVQGTMPANVRATNVHKLAHAGVVRGTPFADRMKRDESMKSYEIAQFLGIDSFKVSDTQWIAEWRVAGYVMATVKKFCQSADVEPSIDHVPYVDGIDAPKDGKRTYENNNRLAAYVEPHAQAAWRDLSNHWGQLPFGHDHYLKLWQLSHPKLHVDVILFDEAQDANPVMAAVVAEQTHAQRVYVGDQNQAIYEFTGAVDAIGEMKRQGMVVGQLTKSFRFGPDVATAANEILVELDADIRIEGFEAIESVVGTFDGDPDAILCRTNACAITLLIDAKERGVDAHLVGGGTELRRFAEGANDLMTKGSTRNGQLACFKSWREVVRYVEEDDLGAELKLNVDLIEKFGVTEILRAIDTMAKEDDATLVISTAHKAKGREWDRVVIASDFVKETKEGEEPQPPSPSELRLQYVAITRARKALDHSVLVTARAE